MEYEFKIDMETNVLFKNELKKRGISITWLADNIGIGIQHCSRILLGNKKLTEKTRQKMNEVLQTNF